MPKSPRKKKSPKRVLALPDLEQAKSAVLNSLTSRSGQRTYDHAITEFVEWYCSEPRLAFNRAVVLRYRISLEQKQYAPSTINLRLAAVRRIAYEAADSGLLRPELAAGIPRVKGVRRLGVRVGNWLTVEQGKRLLESNGADSLRGKRNHAMISINPHRMWPATGRIARPEHEIDSAARRALGDRRFNRKSRSHPHGADSVLGKESRGCLDRAGAHRRRPGISLDQ